MATITAQGVTSWTLRDVYLRIGHEQTQALDITPHHQTA